MTSYRSVLVALGLAILATSYVAGEIHRAKLPKKNSGVRVSANVNKAGDNSAGGHSWETWIYSLIGACCVGLSGIFPLLVIPIEAGKSLKKGASAQKLKLLLSFAVGGLLGDVFLHLLPEAWDQLSVLPQGHEEYNRKIGLWVLAGLLTFLIIEKIFPYGSDDDDDDEEAADKDSTPAQYSAVSHNGHYMTALPATNLQQSKGKKVHRRKASKPDAAARDTAQHSDGRASNGIVSNRVAHSLQNGSTTSNGKAASHQDAPPTTQHIKTCGWLNLLANIIDNFTHGLAVAGSFCVSTKSGIITTAIILMHEIPHEVGDFAILLRSGFDRWKAAKAQVLTASGGLLGAFTALMAESAQEAGTRTVWILPFTSGGFIYVALVTVVPDLLKEKNSWESFKQVLFLLLGVSAMGVVSFWFDEHNLPFEDWFTSTPNTTTV